MELRTLDRQTDRRIQCQQNKTQKSKKQQNPMEKVTRSSGFGPETPLL